jgi:hypothetical protein
VIEVRAHPVEYGPPMDADVDNILGLGCLYYGGRSTALLASDNSFGRVANAPLEAVETVGSSAFSSDVSAC